MATLKFTKATTTVTGAITSSGTGILDVGTADVTVSGAVTLGSTATLNITIGTDNGSIIATTNGVSLQSGTTLVPTIVGTITSGQAITIIQSTGGVVTIPTITDNNLRLDFVAAQSGNDLTLTATTLSSSALGLTGTTAEINDIVDTAFSGDALLDELNGLSSNAELDTALETLAPTVNGGAIVGSVSAGTASRKVVQTRMASLRIGISAGQGLASGDEYAGERNFWTQGFGTFADQDERDGFDGFDVVTAGFALGADRPFTRNLTAGLAFSYAYTNINSDSSSNQTQINSFQGTVYSSYELGSYFLESMVSLAYNTYEGLRNIKVGSVERRARADYDGVQGSIKAGLGREFRFDNGIEITPTLSLQYTHVYIDSYTEAGADSSNLKVDSQSFNSLFLTLNSEFSKTYEIDEGSLTPEIHIGYMYEALDEKVATTSTFTGGGGSFKTTGFDQANHSLLVGVGLTFADMNNFNLKATYDMEGKDDFISHSAVIRAEWKF